MYIYEGCTGALFTSEEYLSYEDSYCELCGDSDTYIGCADNKRAAWNLLKPITNIKGSGGWDYKYVKDFINDNFED